ncbi:MAG: outer membrane beta-barrel protein [Candidatus Zixiibacteriota bacterium]
MNTNQLIRRTAFSTPLLTLVFLAVTLTSAPAGAGPFSGRDMVGGRIGAWANDGDRGRTDGRMGQEISSSSPYAELFFNHSFSSWFNAELALGNSKRAELVSDRLTIIDGINLYPMQVSLKVYPLGPMGLGKAYPFIQGGVGFSIARQSVRRIGSITGGSNTKTDFDFLLGGGFDFPVANKIALTVAGKYHRIDFGDGQFLGASDFSGYSIAVGAAYLFPIGRR